MLVDNFRQAETPPHPRRTTGTADIERAVDGMVDSLFRVWMKRGAAFANHPVTKELLILCNSISVGLGMGADFATTASMIGLTLPGAKTDND